MFIASSASKDTILIAVEEDGIIGYVQFGDVHNESLGFRTVGKTDVTVNSKIVGQDLIMVRRIPEVSKLRLTISMSLDGFVAGPRQSVEDPLGIGGTRLHEWAFPLSQFRALHGLEGGEVNESTPVVEESLANIGATVMGRNMFGGHPGPWDTKKPWDGWWGTNPPFHHPVFVLTHHARAALELEGGTSFTFVTGGIEDALEQAKRAAGGKDVALSGGANAARQYLVAGLVDEMEINLVPTLLGSGERLFDGVGDDLHGLELVRTVAAPKVTHLKFARR